MIELLVQNNQVLVYEANDWETLRKTYRMVGELGCATATLPTLPLKLMTEEVYLLVNIGAAKLVCYDGLKIEPTQEQITIREQFDKNLHQALQVAYRNERKEQLNSRIDDIVAAKRKKDDKRSKEEIYDDELQKTVVTEQNMIYPNFLREKDIGMSTNYDITRLFESTKEYNCKIFVDLWKKGYFVTSGSKFGGDYLLYLGDPLLNHAAYIVKCVDSSSSVHCTELVAFGRLANAVKKKALFAYFDKDLNIFSYNTLSWPHV